MFSIFLKEGFLYSFVYPPVTLKGQLDKGHSGNMRQSGQHENLFDDDADEK